MSDWKPGDVAMVSALNRPEPYRAFYDGKTWREYDGAMFCVDAPQTFRPLVVIDPEDREAVERLLAGYHDWKWARERSEASINDMQAALREFANPKPPKPDEPQGLGAVVEDADGLRWIRWWVNGSDHSSKGRPWTGANGVGSDRSYDQIPVVHVLSEGVQP